MVSSSSRSTAPGWTSRPGIPKNKTAPRVIAVTGGSMSVGKSCLVVNLGLALSRMGKKVLILDADFCQPHIHALLGLTPRLSIIDVLTGAHCLPEVILMGPEGLHIVPGGLVPGELAQLTQAQKLLLLDELDDCAADFDFLLVDTGAGLSQDVLYFNLGAQERLVVADDQPASVIAAYTLIKVLATNYAQKRFKLLFNKISRGLEARHAFDQLTKVADRFLRGSVSLEFMGFIPFDPAWASAAALHQALVDISPSSPANLACTETARRLMSQEPYTALDGNIKFFWQNLNRRAAVSYCPGAPHEDQLR